MEEVFRKLIAYPSVTSNIQANVQMVNYIAEYLRKRGMYIEHFEWDDYPALVATTEPKRKTPTIMLAAHTDVVSAPEPMFKLRKENGKYIGRGVMDMKCAIAAYMQVVDDLKPVLSDYDFGIMITSDEEIGGKDGVNGVKRLIDTGYIPKAVVLPDGGQDWQLETISNGFVHITLEARGKSAHSSRPWEGENATFKLISALHELKEHFKDQGPATDTLNIGPIENNALVNRISDFARAEITMRLTVPGGLRQREAFVQQICKTHDITSIKRSGWDMTYNSLDNPYVRTFADLTERVTGIKIVGFRSYAGSDARFFGELGIPYANAYPRGGGHHSDHEWLAEESLEQLKEIVRLYLHETALHSVAFPRLAEDVAIPKEAVTLTAVQ